MKLSECCHVYVFVCVDLSIFLLPINNFVPIGQFITKAELSFLQIS